MADETPKPANPQDAQADPLAAELAAMGSFDDAPGAGQNGPPTDVGAKPVSTDAQPDAIPPDMAELEALLKQASFEDGTAAGNAASAAVQNVSSQVSSVEDDLASQLFAEAQAAVAAERAGAPMRDLPSTSPLDLPAFQEALSDSQASSIDLLKDVELNVKIELGRAEMMVEDVLKLGEGSVVELDKLAGDPVDVFVNDRLVARGEVLVLNDNFCVRVNEIVTTLKEET